jgi:hypothetical protein
MVRTRLPRVRRTLNELPRLLQPGLGWHVRGQLFGLARGVGPTEVCAGSAKVGFSGQPSQPERCKGYSYSSSCVNPAGLRGIFDEMGKVPIDKKSPDRRDFMAKYGMEMLGAPISASSWMHQYS